MPRKSNAEYQKTYRDRKKAEAAFLSRNEQADQAPAEKPASEMPFATATLYPRATVSQNDDGTMTVTETPLTDRQLGLPRSNYASRHDEPGGWKDTIVNIDPHLATTILDRIATKKR